MAAWPIIHNLKLFLNPENAQAHTEKSGYDQKINKLSPVSFMCCVLFELSSASDEYCCVRGYVFQKNDE